jgi:fructan beta-fructosidase
MKFIFIIMLSLFSAKVNAQKKVAIYKEPYRPQFHFTPATNWCNDPNGLVYNNGIYHLFYQHNPFGNVWGHMTWGHATSTDLVQWKHLPIAIPEEKDTMIFSGTCVVDKNNTSGFGKNGKIPMVAVYTAHIENVNQSQHIAYSLDDGLSWTKYNANPILDLQKKDFRDPKIFWYAPKQYWVMAVMLPIEHIMQLYSSFNLKDWKHLSNFGPVGDTSGVWECPDLTQVPIEGMPGKKKWLLQMSMNATMQYFVGEFDGVHFKNENPTTEILRPDYGTDYYAAIAYNQLPSSQLPTAIGWINNWNYANDIPTTPWKGAMSLPRTLSVKKEGNTWILLQQPIAALQKLRGKAIEIKNTSVTGEQLLPFNGLQFEMDVLLKPDKNVTDCGIKITVGNNSFVNIGYNVKDNNIYIDRQNCINSNFNANFKKHAVSKTKLRALQNGTLPLKIFVDNSIVEVFVQHGEKVLTAQFFSEAANTGVAYFSYGGNTQFRNSTAWTINPKINKLQ